jgi:L-ascorbate metabolism protein UlaG (beta-lactamase superfamily)
MPFPVTDHCDGTRFFNPHARGEKTLRDLLRWMLFERAEPWPAAVPLPAVAPPPSVVAPESLAVTFVNHCTFLLQWAGVRVLTDPIFSMRASPVRWAGPRRVMAPGLALDALPRIDVLVVSHNHYDHLDAASVRSIVERDRPTVVAPIGNARVLAPLGRATVVECDWWETWQHGPLRIRVVPAQHWSNRLGVARNTALWGGFWLEAHGRSVYFAADSGYGPHFAEIGRRCGRPDVSLLPIGAYEPRWFMREQHMNPAEAVQAHQDLDSRLSLASHFGTFRLTNEAHDAPVRALRDALDSQPGLARRFRVLAQGETIQVPGA